ncbi:MAG: prepilin-type N-terminal cleavage/methylation domain-containing protein [Elusimicrobia bacterium]|nr:prepilin-type N-terminal cleavage/methylation domain-containing protein [Elusimicrobiota bacterium]
MTRFRQTKGFTLIELMLVVAIIGLLAAIAIPKFAGLIIKSKEASVKGKLGSLRSAISIYYSDNEGTFPSPAGVVLDPLTVGSKYLDRIPTISIPTFSGHAVDNGVCAGILTDWGVCGAPGTYAWTYFSITGIAIVNCQHPDSSGRVWTTW